VYSRAGIIRGNGENECCVTPVADEVIVAREFWIITAPAWLTLGSVARGQGLVTREPLARPPIQR